MYDDDFKHTSSIVAIGTPSAIDTNKCFTLTSILISFSTFGTTFGLTASRMISAFRRTSLFSCVMSQPSF